MTTPTGTAQQLETFYESRFGAGAHINGRIRKAADLLKRLSHSPTQLLDVGCGIGKMALYMGDVLGIQEVYGIDIAPSQVEEACQQGVKASYNNIDETPLPFENEMFDAVYCGEVIEHVLDTDQLLSEIYRVLSPSGVAVISTPNLGSWFNRISLFFGYQPFYTQVSFKHSVGRFPGLGGEGAGGHIRVFTHRALKELLEIHGFRILKSRSVNVFDMHPMNELSTASKIIAPLDQIFSIFPSLACDLMFAVEKSAR